MRAVLSALLAAASVAAQPNSLTPAEASEGWLLLFDGQTLHGWKAEGGANWRVVDGAVAAESGENGWLRSTATLADFVLRCDFKTAADGNSGVFLRSAAEGQPHVTGYELQIWNQHPKFPTGSLVNHVAATKRDHKPGEWNTFEVHVEGDRYRVALNGTPVLDSRQDKTRQGHIGLQFNKDQPIAFRNIKVKPLGLKPIFNGRDLSGWKRVDRPNVPSPPEWVVRDGMIHVEKGPGQLETEAQFEDFILQLEIRANSSDPARHPNSGVFFRGDAAGYWTGYEAQIRNEFKDGDRTQAVDFGTGGIYRLQPARRVVSSDNEFFTMTVMARGRQINTWVNGFPVADFHDRNPEGRSVRNQEARLGPGTFSLQAHDPTTNLDFRKLRAVALAK